jgi:AcrR family transcriptional regulator
MESEVKDRIIESAGVLFTENGIKGITMDDLAQHLGMSKRTIYEYFQDKNELVNECILHFEHLRDKKTKEIFETSENMFEALLKLYQQSLINMQNINKNFFYDIKKYFPEINKRHLQRKEEKVKKTAQFFKEGIELGLIRKDLNVEVLSALAEEINLFLFDSDSFLLRKFSFFDIHKTLFLTFLRGIATDKGLSIIDTFMQKEVTN